jgi:hypothetical protein
MARKILNGLDLQSRKIIGVADGTAATDAVNRQQLDGRGFVDLVADHNAVGDDSTINTTAFNAAITAAGRDKTIIISKSGTYRINDELSLAMAGVTIEAANGIYARIRQVTANKHCFKLIPDTAYDYTVAIGITLRGLRLIGPGAGTTGVGIWSDPGAVGYQGQRLTLDDVHVEGFDVGALLYKFDNLFAQDLTFKSCRVGWQSSGNANSIHLVNCGASTISEVAYRFGDGHGVTFHPGDIINSAKAIEVQSGGQVTLIGGNFESCTGSAFIDLLSGANMVAFGQRFLKGSVEAPGFRVDLASLIEGGGKMAGFTTAPLIKKVNDTAVVVAYTAVSNLSNVERTVQHSDANLATQGHAPFPQRIDNSVPGGAVQYRGLVLNKVVRDTVTAEDGLFWYGKDRRSGSDIYTRRTLSAVITGTGTPEGAVTAGVGVVYMREDGAGGTVMYVKESGTGNTGWRAFARAVETFAFSKAGTLAVGAGTHRIYMEYAGTVTSVRASVGTAPTGASVIVDVNKNGSTIYGTQANRPTIAASGNTAVGGAASGAAFAANDYLTVDIDQIGSTVAGADLTVAVQVERT